MILEAAYRLISEFSFFIKSSNFLEINSNRNLSFNQKYLLNIIKENLIYF